jgi:hypothetical protein
MPTPTSNCQETVRRKADTLREKNMLKIIQSTVVIGLVVILVVGCTLTRGSSVLVGKKRAPIDPSVVKLYLEPPAKYEQVAILSADARNAFASEQNLTDNTIERLKREAAALGANGILLQGFGNFQAGTTGVATVNPGYPGTPIVTGASGVVMGKEGKGMAIFVIQE